MKDDKGVKQLWEKMKQQKEEQEKVTKTAPAASGGKKATAATAATKSTTAPVVDKAQAQQAGEKAKAEGEGVEITDVDDEEEEKQREEHVNRLLGNINIFADMQRDKHEREEMLEYGARLPRPLPSVHRRTSCASLIDAHAHAPPHTHTHTTLCHSQEADGSEERDPLPREVGHQGQGAARSLLGQSIRRIPPGTNTQVTAASWWWVVVVALCTDCRRDG